MSIDLFALRARADAGQTKARIGRDLGVSPMAVYRAAKRHGITMSSRLGHSLPATLREAVQDMPLREALEFVLLAYEELSGQDERGRSTAVSLGLGNQHAVLFSLLERAHGRMVTREALASAASAVGNPDRPMTYNALSVQVHNLRALVRGKYEITTRYGVGYSMEKL